MQVFNQNERKFFFIFYFLVYMNAKLHIDNRFYLTKTVTNLYSTEKMLIIQLFMVIVK